MENIKYICACNVQSHDFIEWWVCCDCKYCLYIKESETRGIRIRVNDKFAIYICKEKYKFEYEKFDSTLRLFGRQKYIDPKIKFESESEMINYFIKYSDNIIFE